MVNKFFKLDIDGNEININIKNNGNSNKVSIKFYRGYITIIKPTKLSSIKLNKILNENKDKIKNDYIKHICCYNKENLNLNENTMLYNGIEYKVCICEVDGNKCSLDFNNEIFYLYIVKRIKNSEKDEIIFKLFKNFYKLKTYEFLKDELEVWSNITGIKYNKFSVKDVKTRWGSCVKQTRSLNFSLKLAMLPKFVRSGIIVHELCHIIEANHGSDFWGLVYKYIPDYDECKSWLKENRDKLNIL